MPISAYIMIKTTSETKNGIMRIHTVKTDKYKMSRFSINFITKSDKINTPLSKLMLSVMLRGSEKYPTVTSINKALDEQYGTAVSFGSSSVGDKTVHKISCKLINDRFLLDGDDTDILENVMAIVSDILLHPLTDEKGSLLSQFVESEKRIAIDHINAKINDPKSYASEQCSKYMFENSKYSVVADGDEELISSFTPEMLTENIKSFFASSRIEFFYVGNKSNGEIKTLVEKYFPIGGDCSNAIDYSESAFESKKKDVRYIEDVADVSQGRLVLGYRCNTVLSDPDRYAMSLFNEIFGGGSVSKLFMNVREKKSLCYYCYSSYHTATGTIKVGCGIDPTKKDEAIEEIALQLDEMKRGNITGGEIETAKNTLCSGIKQVSDTPASIEAFALRRMLANVSEEPDDCIKEIRAVTKEQIIAAANKVELDTVYFLTGSGEYEEDECDE